MSTSSSNHNVRRVLQAGTIAIAVGAGYAAHNLSATAQGGAATVPPTQHTPVVQTPATRDAATTQNAFSEVAESVEPAVVTIETIGPRVRVAAPGGGSGRIPGLPFGGGQGQDGDNEGDPNGDFQQFFKDFQQKFGFNQQSYQPNSIEGRVLRDRAQAKWREIQSSRRSGGLGSGMIYSPNGQIGRAHV